MDAEMKLSYYYNAIAQVDAMKNPNDKMPSKTEIKHFIMQVLLQNWKQCNK